MNFGHFFRVILGRDQGHAQHVPLRHQVYELVVRGGCRRPLARDKLLTPFRSRTFAKFGLEAFGNQLLALTYGAHESRETAPTKTVPKDRPITRAPMATPKDEIRRDHSDRPSIETNSPALKLQGGHEGPSR